MDESRQLALVKLVIRARRRERPRKEIVRLLRDKGVHANEVDHLYAEIIHGLHRGDGCLYRGLSPRNEIDKIDSDIGRAAFYHALKKRSRKGRWLKVLAVLGVLVFIGAILAINYFQWVRDTLGLGRR
ncbi:MAG TPA: hypothetical protein VM695_10660 [Phycisphaerae bacterium]|nr:hypothetical protein [Phycisphaerae bacterium]